MNDEMANALQQVLGKDKACYVVISCDEPEEDGNMQVEMNYQGDPTLAAYLLDSARIYIDEQCELETPPGSKRVPLMES